MSILRFHTRKVSTRISNDRPTLKTGLESLANIKGRMRFNQYVFSNDIDDLRNDWITIGNDIRKAMSLYGK
ncbi:MAG: hypothetical protein E7104_00505 [Prevotella sp.]|jgi:hypothetical protein|nr:hypothetical protein [Prevotella sp.]